jgi:hypothetical protein
MAETTIAEAPAKAAAPEVKPAVNGAATQATPKQEEATEEVKVNGKIVKLTKAQLVAAAQKGLFADQRNKSFDVLKGKTEALINALKTPDGLLEVLRDPALGASPKEVFRKLMASEVIDDELKEEMSKWVYDNVVVQAKKTPEEIERDKKLSDYERLKKAEEERKVKELSVQQQQKVQEIYQAVRAEVTKQILADKTFPQTEGSIRAVVDKLRVMNRQGATITTETVTKALNLVKNDHIMHQQALLDSIEDPEGLIAMIGEARALKISRALVARLQAKAKAKTQEAPKSESGVREKVTDRIDKKLGKTPQGYHILEV